MNRTGSAWHWECAATEPGAAADPAGLQHVDTEWIAAAVPGTAAAALRANGTWEWGVTDTDRLDGRDWWFRCRFADPGDGPWDLRFGGLATIADVWLNRAHLLHGDNMFVEHECAIDRLEADNELCIRFASLTPVLAERRARPRWKTRLLRNPNLRWIRTTLLGRIDGWAAWAAPVGPWGPVELVARGDRPRVVASTVAARCAADGVGGEVSVRATVAFTGTPPAGATMRVGDATAPLAVAADGAHVTVEGTLRLAAVERWWPHTHGEQPLSLVELEIDGAVIPLAHVGFRTVEVDRRDDGFTFVVNGTPIFCRGAIWVPPDVVSFAAAPEQVRASLELLRDAGMNTVRLAGHGIYERRDFWDLCDELGIMVWQDCMLASADPPDSEAFAAEIEAELAQVLAPLRSRPALALVCGGTETYQQAAMFGLAPGTWESPLLERTIPAVVERVLPGVAYIPTSPIGGDLPFDPAVGVAHYFGVGAYERPLTDARAAGVRFASECLAFSNPPERESVRAAFGERAARTIPAAWKAGIPRDTGTDWDFEDVRDFYVHALFGRDAAEVRKADPERALDLGRAAVAEVMAAVMTEWRRPGSRCSGGLVLAWQDLWPGAGWGIVDSLGRPKSPWYALRRVLDPIAVLMTDEGLSGLSLHVVNDRPVPFRGRLELAAFADTGMRVEHAEEAVEVAAHGAVTVSAASLLGGFRDLTRAYRFGPPAHDVVMATLTSQTGTSGGAIERTAFFLPLGPARPRVDDLGLAGRVTRVGEREWTLAVQTEQFAQWVAIDVPGFAPSDSWFHLAPGTRRELRLRACDSGLTPAGELRALNSSVTAPIGPAERP